MKKAQKIERNPIPALCLTFILLLLGMINVGWCGFTQSKTPPAKKIETAVNKGAEKVVSKFHEAADSLGKEKVHESIDQIAGYLDKDKLKEQIDELADYFDKEKMKEFIDYAADHLDRDKIKGMIDFVAEILDRDKVKQTVDQLAAFFDKEQIKEKFDQTVDQITGSLAELTRSLEEELLQSGNNKTAVQDLLKKYDWKKYIQNSASYGPATLSDLKLSGLQKSVTVVKPGQEVGGEVVCFLNPKECSSLGFYRVVLGLKNKGGQTTIFNHFGLRAGKETDRFTLVAPREKGVYEIAFRVVEAAREGTALKLWDDQNENKWGEPTTIGLLIVN